MFQIVRTIPVYDQDTFTIVRTEQRILRRTYGSKGLAIRLANQMQANSAQDIFQVVPARTSRSQALAA